MKKDDFKELDKIHVPSHAKEKLLYQVNQEFSRKEMKERNTGMRYKGLLAAGAAFLLVAGLITMNGSGTVDYEGYYNAVASYVDTPQEQLNRDNLQLDNRLLNREITIEEYLEQKNQIGIQQQQINDKKQEIRTKYKINEENLDNTRFSKDPEKNAMIISNLKTEMELEKQEEAIDLQQNQAIQDYRDGKITADQLIKTMVDLDARDTLLDKEDDRIDGEQPDQEDLAEYQLAEDYLSGKITIQEYLDEKEKIDDLYDDDDLDDDDDDDFDDIDDDDEDEDDD